MEMKNLQIIETKISQHFLNSARSVECSNKDFRFYIERITDTLLVEAFQNLPVVNRDVKTPLETMKNAEFLDDSEIVFASVMRAGNAMLEAAIRFLPTASAAHIGIQRNEKHEAVSYYYRSSNLSSKRVFLLDPMLATGGSAVQAVSMLKEHGAAQVIMLCVLCSKVGVEKLHENHPDVKILTCSLDRELNDKAYILPGLGDAGDRIYGTTSSH